MAANLPDCLFYTFLKRVLYNHCTHEPSIYQDEMLHSLVKLSDDAAGLEKMLRFGQYASQTVAALLTDSIEFATPWKQAQSHFALSTVSPRW